MRELGSSAGVYEGEPGVILPDLRQISVSWWGLLRQGLIDPLLFDLFEVDVGGWIISSATHLLVFNVQRSTATFAMAQDTTPSSTEHTHFAVTWDGTFTTGSVRWWLNGVEDTVTEDLGSGTRGFGTPIETILGGAHIGFGGVNEVGWFAVWNRVLHDAEVSQLSRRTSPLHFPVGLMSYWRVDNEQRANDLAGNADLWVRSPLTGPPYVQTNIDVVDPSGRQFLPGAAATNLPDDDTVFTIRRKGHRIKRAM